MILIGNIFLLLIALNPLSKVLFLHFFSDTRRKSILYSSTCYTILMLFLFVFFYDFIPVSFFLYVKQYEYLIKVCCVIYTLICIFQQLYFKSILLRTNAFFPFTVPLNIGPAFIALLAIFIAVYGIVYAFFYGLIAILFNFLICYVTLKFVKIK